MAYSRHPYSGYSGYGSPSRSGSTSRPSDVPTDYPEKEKGSTAAEHLAVLQKYHDKKREEHGAMWRAPDHFHKDVAMHQALAQIERAFPQRKK